MASTQSLRSVFAGQRLAFKSLSVVAKPVKPLVCTVQASKSCDLTGTKRNKAHSVSFSNKKTRKFQEPNLQHKKVYWEAGQRWVKLRITTRAMKTIEKNGIDIMAAEAGIDLWKLPFEDARPERLAYLAANPRKVPVARNPRAMKNPEKLAASKKQPKYPVYEEGGRIVYIRPGMEAWVYGEKSETDKAAEAKAAEEEKSELKITITG